MTKYQQQVHEALLALGGYASCGDVADHINSSAIHVSTAAGRMNDLIAVRPEKVNGRELVMLHALKPKPEQKEN